MLINGIMPLAAVAPLLLYSVTAQLTSGVNRPPPNPLPTPPASPHKTDHYTSSKGHFISTVKTNYVVTTLDAEPTSVDTYIPPPRTNLGPASPPPEVTYQYPNTPHPSFIVPSATPSIQTSTLPGGNTTILTVSPKPAPSVKIEYHVPTQHCVWERHFQHISFMMLIMNWHPADFESMIRDHCKMYQWDVQPVDKLSIDYAMGWQWRLRWRTWNTITDGFGDPISCTNAMVLQFGGINLHPHNPRKPAHHICERQKKLDKTWFTDDWWLNGNPDGT